MYIEQNYGNLRKDQCSKQLILLPNDDIYAENGSKNELITNESNDVDETICENNKFKTFLSNNLFVTDCLETYLNKKYQIKYKYHDYSGSYRQLPNYQENYKTFMTQMDNIE